MAIVKTGQGVVDIRGSFGGVYFTRDKSGLHQSAKPRTIHRLSAKQRIQRNAFRKARAYTKDPRWVSYYIYRALNNLPFVFDTKVTGDPDPNCNGTYVVEGQHNGLDYYRHTAGTWFIWWDGAMSWVISQELGVLGPASWFRIDTNIVGPYLWGGGAAGTPTVGLHLQPPPADYQIPKL